ncbi:MAG: hypothetical protein ABJG68_07235 [Crocinitomicaceae bacterium]
MDIVSNAIASLEFLVKEHAILIRIIDDSVFLKHWKLIELQIENESFRFQIDDEYEDLKLEIPALALCVVLRSLEEYKESTDFLDWCKKTGMPSNNNALEYFRTLAEILVAVENKIEEVNSFISDIEFTLNSGAAQELRNSK